MGEKTIEEIFNTAVDEYSDMVTRICIVSLGNMIDAQDAYLNTFESLFVQLKKKQPDDIGKWLAKVAYNECKSMLRFKLRHRFVSIDDITLPFDSQEDIELIQLIFSLPEKYRNVLHLYVNAGCSTREIAEITGQKESTVRSQLKRAREKLKKELEKGG